MVGFAAVLRATPVQAAGALDPTFGTGGTVTTPFFVFPVGPVDATAQGVALQSDGAIVVAGSSGAGVPVVARY